MLNLCNFCTCYVPLQFGRLINVVDMSDNNRSVNSEQLRNLRLRQPHAVVLHTNIQAGLAVGRLVYDNFSSVHRNKDTNKPEISKIRRSDYFTVTQIQFALPYPKVKESVLLLSHQLLEILAIIAPIAFAVTGKIPNIHYFPKPKRQLLTIPDKSFGSATKKTVT